MKIEEIYLESKGVSKKLGKKNLKLDYNSSEEEHKPIERNR